MKKFEGIFLATDLDGTLIRKDKSIPEGNLKAINYFMDEGGLFAFVTGRAPVGAMPIYQQLKPNAPCGCLNGGSIYDFENRSILWCIEMPDTVLELVEYVDKKLPHIGIELHTHNNIYFCKPNSGTEKHKANEKLPDLYVGYNDIKEPFAKILFAGESVDDLPELVSLLKNHPRAVDFDFVRSDEKYYEILPKGANKGSLITEITSMLDISPKKVIAVGDNDNDVPMLLKAHIGFAVANATAGAKKAADYVTVSNDECAIAKIIDDLDKGTLDI